MKYERPARRGLDAYELVQFALVALAILRVLFTYQSAPALQTALLGAWIVASLVAWGALYEDRRWALPLEVARLALAPLHALAAIGALGDPSAWIAIGWAALALASIAWVAVLARRWGRPMPAPVFDEWRSARE